MAPAYLADSAHAQMWGLWLAAVGWALSGVSLGLVQWRVWRVADSDVITSGVAWVGVWRACFFSQSVVTSDLRVMHCQHMALSGASTPPEVAVAQVLMLLALLGGVLANGGAVYALRNVYMGVQRLAPVRPSFLAAGALYLLTAGMSLTPLLWNLSSVLTNQTIAFPPEFRMPPAPDSQSVGAGIVVGLVGAGLLLVSGVIFCSYRLPERTRTRTRTRTRAQVSPPALSFEGRDNPGFEIL